VEEIKVDKKESNPKMGRLAQIWCNDTLTAAFQGVGELNEEEAEVILKKCSEVCSKYWLSILIQKYGWSPEKSDFDDFLKAQEAFEKHMSKGNASITRNGNVIEEEFWDGECTCPLVKNYKLVKPFPHLCLCGRNTFKTVYEAGAKRPVQAEVVESYCRGGNRCLLRFRIEDTDD
jgi:hypothetical protein